MTVIPPSRGMRPRGLWPSRLLPWLLALGLLASSGGGALAAKRPFITLASTTSTENSGLFAAILPRFTAETGIDVRVVAVGTGQAIRLARNGDADVLLVHHRASEDRFVAEGLGVGRRDVMYNDFVLVGPGDDPAGIAGLADVGEALGGVARARAPFVSRGDDSGTHKKEMALWRAAKVDPKAASGDWYREVGAGMGAALNISASMGAYVLADRATWIAFKNKRVLRVLVEGDLRLFNPYGVILVNPQRHPHVKAKEGQAFIAWLTGPSGRAAISAFRLEGRQVFFLPGS